METAMYLYGIVVCSLRNSLTESSTFSNSTIGYMSYSVIFALIDCVMKDNFILDAWEGADDHDTQTRLFEVLSFI